MKLLLSADWQSSFDNLDLCEQAADEVFLLCKKYDLHGIVISGDLKREYNPIDTRVVLFWIRFIKRAKAMGLKVVFVLGNHDRVGMYTEAQNWLPIFESAGAIVVYTEPKSISITSGIVHCLPFSSNTETTKRWAAQLANSTSKHTEGQFLIFHNDLFGCSYNTLGQKSDGRLRPSDLYYKSYDACFGGHIHLRQCVKENVFYLGSPFASDWGEANQRKGYTITDGRRFKFVASKIPGWFDPTWPMFPKDAASWKGARVRLHVPIDVGQNYSHVLEQAKKEGERKYAGATVYTVPEFKETETAKIKIKLSDPDATKISAYMDETVPQSLDKHRRAIHSYLIYKLSKACSGLGLRTGGKIEFVSAVAENFLSFESLRLDFTKPGITLVLGKNKDWLNRSNGAGKTNLLQTIPVAYFGKTFKDQKHDGWALNDSKKPAFVSVRSRDANGRLIKVKRGRRPGFLQMFIDGKDESSGMQSTSQSGTQGAIERVLGFTWQTLANAVYIDQQQVNAFLAGSPAEQKRVLERFQNLERFAVALKEISRDVGMKRRALDDADSERAIAKSRVRTYRSLLAEERPDDADYIAAKKKYLKAKLVLHTLQQKDTRKLESKITKREQRLESSEVRYLSLKTEAARTSGERVVVVEQLRKLRSAREHKNCPTCGQEIDKEHLNKHIDELLCQDNKLVKLYNQQIVDSREVGDSVQEAESSLRMAKMLLNQHEVAIAHTRSTWVRVREIYRMTRRHRDETQAKQRTLERQLRHARRDLKFWLRQIEITNEELGILEYCEQAFSRNGVPAFLNAQICPALNKAAEHYSEVFSGKEIQVRFKMVDAEFQVEVLNAHGGTEVQDQSAGEKKMAAIIASFALRAIAPPCNLLVLDEPGDGLDAVNAKAFAVGLKTLKNSLGTVLLTTHNPIIQGELSGESSITVVKSGGVSRVS